MSMTQKNSLGKGPLPGGRQGVRGASTAHDSMQAASDGVLSRRATIGSPECITADQNFSEAHVKSSVLSEHSRGTIGSPRSRKLTKEQPSSQNLGRVSDECMMDIDDDSSTSVSRTKPKKTTRLLMERIRSNVSTPRYLLLKPINGDFSKTSPFGIAKHIKAAFGEVKSIRKVRGCLLLETSNPGQSSRILKVKKFFDMDIEVVPHPTLNYSKGVITCRDLLNCSVEEICDELRDQGVINVKRITVVRQGLRTDTGSCILTFDRPELPPKVLAGFYSLPVRVYIPEPLRCFRCQRFGHTSSNCRSSAMCACGMPPHGGESCSGPIICPNCSGGHSAKSKSCPIYKEEAAIQRLRTIEKISYLEAKQKVKPTAVARNRSFAEVAARPTNQALAAKQIAAELAPLVLQLIRAERTTAIHDDEKVASKANTVPAEHQDEAFIPNEEEMISQRADAVKGVTEHKEQSLSTSNVKSLEMQTLGKGFYQFSGAASVARKLESTSDLSVTSPTRSRRSSSSSEGDKPPRKRTQGQTLRKIKDPATQYRNKESEMEYLHESDTDSEMFTMSNQFSNDTVNVTASESLTSSTTPIKTTGHKR